MRGIPKPPRPKPPKPRPIDPAEVVPPDVWFARRIEIANWWNEHHEEFPTG